MLRVGEQAVDCPIAFLTVVAVEKTANFINRRQSAKRIQRHTTQELCIVGLRRGGQVQLPQAIVNQRVDKTLIRRCSQIGSARELKGLHQSLPQVIPPPGVPVISGGFGIGDDHGNRGKATSVGDNDMSRTGPHGPDQAVGCHLDHAWIAAFKTAEARHGLAGRVLASGLNRERGTVIGPGEVQGRRFHRDLVDRAALRRCVCPLPNPS